MRRSCLMYGLTLVILSFGIQPSWVQAANEPTFYIHSDQNEDQLQVTVQTQKINDLYAYDLSIIYDKLRLKWIQAVSENSGFSIEPIAQDNQIRFAHTLIGKTPGLDGDVSLMTLTFERIRGGDATISLNGARLIDSNLVSSSYTPNVQVEIADIAKHATLTDIHGHWAESAIAEAVELGFVAGYADGTFRPQSSVTRAEFVTMLAQALLMSAEAETVNEQELNFTDQAHIPGWSRPWVGAAVKAGLLHGYADHTIRPGQRITRVEAIALLVQVLGRKSNVKPLLTLTDRDQIPAWGQAYIADALEVGLVKGMSGNRIAPNDRTTRAEAVRMILSLLQLKE
jgi:hypothetical protein